MISRSTSTDGTVIRRRGRRFDGILKGLGGGNPIVVSGDSHAFWLNQLRALSGGPTLAVEFGVSAITSPSIGEYAGFQLGDAFVAQKGKSPSVTSSPRAMSA